MSSQIEGLTAYLKAIQSLQEGIMEHAETLSKVAELMVEAVIHGRRNFLFGAGHSHIVAEEGHYCAGGLACIVPILVPALMLHESSQIATRIERTVGLSHRVLWNTTRNWFKTR
jgi:uncharacterized phosphosugar-binding protein